MRKVIFYSCALLTLLFVKLNLSGQTNIGSNWRGPARDGKYTEQGLLNSWGENGPKMLWSYEGLGDGYSSVAIKGTNIFINGMLNNTGFLFKFDKNGTLIWKKEYGSEWFINFKGTRSTPTIYKGNIYVFSGRGVVYCLDAEYGNKIWSVDVLDTTDAHNIKFGITENLLIVDDKVICTPGGKKKNVMALDYRTGEVIWESEGKSEKSAYSSPIFLSLRSGNIIITHTSESLIALDPENGKLKWSTPHSHGKNTNPNCPIYHDGELFCVSGYGFGCQKIKLSEDGLSAKQVWQNDSLDNKMGGVILVDGYLYGSGDRHREWRCLDWETGEQMYESDSLKASGTTIFADGMLYYYSYKGVMALIKPNTKELEIVSKFDVPLGTSQHFSHPVIDDGRLYIRHGDALMVYSIKN